MYATYTTRQLLTVLNKIYKQTRRELAGGLCYGLDLATFRVLYPYRARVFREVQQEVTERIQARS